MRRSPESGPETLHSWSLCSFFPVMFPYSLKYCIFTAPSFFMYICKAEEHLSQTSDYKAGRSIKENWKMCSQMPEVWLACSRVLSFIFASLLLVRTVTYFLILWMRNWEGDNWRPDSAKVAQYFGLLFWLTILNDYLRCQDRLFFFSEYLKFNITL